MGKGQSKSQYLAARSISVIILAVLCCISMASPSASSTDKIMDETPSGSPPVSPLPSSPTSAKLLLSEETAQAKAKQFALASGESVTTVVKTVAQNVEVLESKIDPQAVLATTSNLLSKKSSSIKTIKKVQPLTTPLTRTELESAAWLFAPEFLLHTNETYWPTSLEDLVDGATLNGVDEKGNATTVSNPTQSDLATLSNSDSTITLATSIDAHSGVVGTEWNRLAQAPVYYAIQVPPDNSYVVIHYVSLYRANGAQTIRSVEGNDFQFPHAAEHDGDLEQVSVLLNANATVCEAVRFESHGDSFWATADSVSFTQGTHPQVRMALNSHAFYNGFGLPLAYGFSLTNYGAAKGVDLTTESPSWALLNIANNLLLTWTEAGEPVVTASSSAVPTNIQKTNVWSPSPFSSSPPPANTPITLRACGSQALTASASTHTVSLASCDDNSNSQKWRFIPSVTSSGDFVLQSCVGGSPVLTVTPGSPPTVSVSALVVSTEANQVWRVIKLGPAWRPWQLTNGLRRVGVVSGTANPWQPLPDSEVWALYKGRLGSFQTNVVVGGKSIDGTPLNPLQASEAATITTVLNSYFQVNPADAEGSPASGPGSRLVFPGNLLYPSVPYTLSSSDPYVIITSRINSLPLGGPSFVLSTAHDDGRHVVVRPRASPADPSQVWRQRTIDAVNIIFYNVASGAVVLLPGRQQTVMYTYPTGCISKSGDVSMWKPNTSASLLPNVIAIQMADGDNVWTVNVLSGIPLLSTEYNVASGPLIPGNVAQLWTIQTVSPV